MAQSARALATGALGPLAAVLLQVALGCSTGEPVDDSGDDTSAGRDTSPATTSRFERIGSVEHWLYLIDVDLDADTVDQVVDSEHDMVVLDFIPSERQNTDYPINDVVDRLHESDDERLVVAYIDVGQAEDYRDYWEDHWAIGDPDWIVASDPDGWEGNYPVAYWRPEWHEIWLGDEGLISRIVDAGFDGVYLDWVEAYSDENVITASQSDDVDPTDEMVDWVAALAETGRDGNPGFLVIAQNAAELAAERADYRAHIDAVAQEQTWFDGAADNDPPGDCPLPRTEALVDTEEYEGTLDEACLRQYTEFPDSTLHVSSEEYLDSLVAVHTAGLPVLTVDYARDLDNVDYVLDTSREHGFIPFVGSRLLDEYVPPR